MMQKRTPGDLVQLATRIPQRLHRAARLRAVEEERPLGTLVAEALTEHLARCRRQPQDRRVAEE
jgi:predicted HicB family RNase H-like nuclease